MKNVIKILFYLFLALLALGFAIILFGREGNATAFVFGFGPIIAILFILIVALTPLLLLSSRKAPTESSVISVDGGEKNPMLVPLLVFALVVFGVIFYKYGKGILNEIGVWL